jgi:serine/threonine protein phosphatase 1
VFLRGNHEQAWLSQWDGRGFRGPPDIQGAEKGWADFGWDPPAEFGYWLARTWIEHEDEHAYYVHAGLLPGKPVWETPDLIKLTGAPGFMESPHDWGKPVVFGHHELPEPLLLPNKIGVDTGAWRTGVLTAVRLPDRAMFQTHR